MTFNPLQRCSDYVRPHKFDVSDHVGTAVIGTDVRRLFERPLDWRTSVFLVLLVALALRCYCAMFLVGSIDTEGIEYARIGENLLAGHGYVGIATPGTELMFPPLFPFLIAAATLITHQSEIAGRAISVIMGTLLVIPVRLIADKMYGQRTAQVAGILVAVHPTLINMSTSVYCESTYFTLVMSGVYLAVCCTASGRRWCFAACGAMLGLAYLVRPEAAAYPVLFVLLMAWTALSRDGQGVRRVLRGSPLLIGTFALLAAPYIVWLSVQAGGLRIEGKGALNFAIAEAMASGETEQAAMYGIGPDLQGQGVWMRSNLDVIRSVKYDPVSLLKITKSNTVENLSTAITDITDGTFLGSPILWVLVILGLFGRRWNRNTQETQPYLFAVVGIPLLASVTISHLQLQSRYFLLLLPVMIIWAAKGLSHLTQWVETTLRIKGWHAIWSRRVGMSIAAVATAAVLLVAVRGIEEDQFLRAFGKSSLPVKVAGEWLRAFAPGPITVMDASAILPYYAKASFEVYPEADEATALRYIAAKKVDFLVLQEKWLPPTPYAHAWLATGIPSPDAHLVYSVDTGARGRILIYQMTPPAAG
jgi:4-amino-4-deoxy-L-arabinose transferase-like glycosyltransferase